MLLLIARDAHARVHRRNQSMHARIAATKAHAQMQHRRIFSPTPSTSGPWAGNSAKRARDWKGPMRVKVSEAERISVMDSEPGVLSVGAGHRRRYVRVVPLLIWKLDRPRKDCIVTDCLQTVLRGDLTMA